MIPGVAEMKSQIAASHLDGKVVKHRSAHCEFHDGGGTEKPRPPQSLPQKAHCCGCRRFG
jgi:hypothetical protein